MKTVIDLEEHPEIKTAKTIEIDLGSDTATKVLSVVVGIMIGLQIALLIILNGK